MVQQFFDGDCDVGDFESFPGTFDLVGSLDTGGKFPHWQNPAYATDCLFTVFK